LILGVHTLLYSTDVEATRAFVRDALALPSVDAGHGWLIFAMPPSELAIHPAESAGGAELYLMSDDLERDTERLVAAGATATGAVSEQRWGRLLMLRIPGDVTLGLYEPRHPTALGLA
jgi:hypothetical protein